MVCVSERSCRAAPVRQEVKNKTRRRQLMKIHKLSLIAVLAAAAVLVGSPALRAQEKEKDTKQERTPGAPGQRGDMKERLNRMAEELKLTDAQKPKVEAALKDQAEKMRGLRDAAPEDRREKM